MSPAGSQLQNYFRKYPSLVNCTSIDWFMSWPVEALKAVGDHHLTPLTGLMQEATEVIDTDHVSRSGVTTPGPEAVAPIRPLETITEGFEERDDGSIANTGHKVTAKSQDLAAQ